MATKSKKPTLYFVHGLRGDHHGLRFVADALKEKGYKVINEDLPGSGGAPELKPQNLETHVGTLHKKIKKLPEKPVIIAHSMGTIITSHYLTAHENSAESAVFLAPIIRSTYGNVSTRITYGLATGFLHLLPKKPRDRLLRSKPVSFAISRFLTAHKDKHAFIDGEHYAYSHLFASSASLMGDMKISMTNEVVIPRNTETLFIAGKKDRLASLKVTKKRAKNLKILKDTGHLLIYETPEKVANLIDEFLKQ